MFIFEIAMLTLVVSIAGGIALLVYSAGDFTIFRDGVFVLANSQPKVLWAITACAFILSFTATSIVTAIVQ